MAIEDINFLDLACLLKIGPDTVMEKFGSLINTSFFDASSIAGTLKQKGLIEFTNDFPGPNGMKVTELGKGLMTEAEAKGAEQFDTLDSTILQQMSGGKRMPAELGNTLNIRSKDLAFRLYKLYRQNYIIYELKNGTVDLLLTESGFLKIKGMPMGGMQNIAQQQTPQTPAQKQPVMGGLFGPKQQQQAQQAKTQPDTQVQPVKGNAATIYVVVAVVLVVVILAVLFIMKLI